MNDSSYFEVEEISLKIGLRSSNFKIRQLNSQIILRYLFYDILQSLFLISTA